MGLVAEWLELKLDMVAGKDWTCFLFKKLIVDNGSCYIG